MSEETIADKIYNTLSNRAGPLTRAEIVVSTGISRDAIRKPLAQLLKAGYLLRDMDEADTGIEWISVNPHCPRVKPEPVTAPEPEPVTAPEPEPEPVPAPEPVVKAKATVDKRTIGLDPLQEAYLQGYSEGYHAAMQISQREAFTEGKRSVARKIAALLNIDTQRILG